MIEDCLTCELDPIAKETSKYLHPCMNPKDVNGKKCAWLHRDAIQMIEMFELHQNRPDELDAIDYQNYKLVKSILLAPDKDKEFDPNEFKKEIEANIKRSV